jgi:hypothetical protein
MSMWKWKTSRIVSAARPPEQTNKITNVARSGVMTAQQRLSNIDRVHQMAVLLRPPAALLNVVSPLLTYTPSCQCQSINHLALHVLMLLRNHFAANIALSGHALKSYR